MITDYLQPRKFEAHKIPQRAAPFAFSGCDNAASGSGPDEFSSSSAIPNSIIDITFSVSVITAGPTKSVVTLMEIYGNYPPSTQQPPLFTIPLAKSAS